MTPDVVRSWLRVARDGLFVGVGAYMLIYATRHSAALSLGILSTLIAGGICAAGLPVAFRWEDLFGKREAER